MQQLIGECPVCQGEITDYMTRIVGYMVKVSAWNNTRQKKDFPKRKWMEIKNGYMCKMWIYWQ